MTSCILHHAYAFLDLGFDFQPSLFILKHPPGSYLSSVNHAFLTASPARPMAWSASSWPSLVELWYWQVILESNRYRKTNYQRTRQGHAVSLIHSTKVFSIQWASLPSQTWCYTRPSYNWFLGRSLVWRPSLTCVQSVLFCEQESTFTDSVR